MEPGRREKQATLRRIDEDLMWLESRYKSIDLSGWPDALVYDSGVEGEALIFVPVLPPFEVIHVPQIKHFAGEYRVVTYRRRESLERPIYQAERAEEIGHLMDHLGIESAHFCGLNEGAIAVFALAKIAPRCVKSIVCTGIGADAVVTEFHEWLARHVPFTPGPTLIGQIARWLMLPTAADNYVVAHLWSKTPNAMATLLNGVVPIWRDYQLSAEHLPMPILNILSSPAVSLDSARRFVDVLPRAELRVLPGKAHLCMWTHAAQFNRMMDEFYERLGTGGPAMSDLGRTSGRDRAAGGDERNPKPLSIYWQQFVRFAMTPVVMLLYRLGLLGRLMDHWLMLVTHVGRKSGKVRKTVLYVQGYDPQTREVRVVSAWGESDWFKNVRKSPALQIEIGRERYEPEQRFLEAEEIAELERRFRRRNPLVARVQCWLMGWPWRASDEEFLRYTRSLRGVAFRPRRG